MASQFILLIISSFTISFLLTPLVIFVSKRVKILDNPLRQHPGILHKHPIPRAGGVAMFIAFSLVSLLTIESSPLLISLIIGGFIIVAAGVIDDLHELSPYLRLFVIWPTAALLVIAGGLTFYTTNPFGEGLWYYDTWKIITSLPFFEVILLPAHAIIVVWVIVVINTIKLTKGASQLPGMAFFAFLTLAAVALKYSSGNPAQLETAFLATIMAGAVLAFVPFNFPPERMFPGDSAAAFIGFMLAVLAILSGGKIATAFIVIGIPAIDMFATIAVRLLKRKNPLTTAGQDHLYHKLLLLGVDKRLIILLYWVFTAVLGAISILLDNSREKVLVLVLICGLTILAFILTHLWLQKKLPAT